ncbi:hypothetical protein ACRE_031430 [Hapsidospora chrysogenum ATCC 11550]|uniref:Uncharacterized protein n=1 Tax=Hapsidospora chrysogenum (strain ATCC 11550 / CBS 779.69 / DSM 880 / IAM 14645 / JCM 23072 / IMI 49137) TaxID=857340 RepID=A0A086T9J9_HAPC1|nr:hypothetical protein ACRE_031430 [Hapsidospora chrysogenum ATCC 11550]
MAPHWWILRAVIAFEDRIVDFILRRPGFHRAVGQIHRTIDEAQHGRNPHEPLAPGEATADPEAPARALSFFRHFRDEIKNQIRGKPTDISNQTPKKK